MDRAAWQAIVHRVTKSWMRLEGLSMHMHKLSLCLLCYLKVKYIMWEVKK